MLDPKECKNMYLKKIGKSYTQLSVEEKALLADIYIDNEHGRYPRLLMWSVDKHKKFVEELECAGVCYHELSDMERYAYEDAYDM